jgi:aminoglycoside phosphotransferase (APT) family kinase protein
MVRVTAVRRRPNPYSTLFATEVLELDLSSGDAITVFVKRLDEAQKGHPDKRRRDREPMLYQSLLADPDLPVARCLGVRHDPDGEARELYLEYLDGLDLRYQGLERWYLAARRLAELHRHFAERAEVLRASDFLLRLDQRYFETWAERAVAELAPMHPGCAADLSRIVGRLEPAPALLAAQPITLVHNDLSPKNAIAVTGSEIQRIAFVDWELAGIGCGVLDVVHLAYGLDHDACQRLFDAYWGALEGSSLAVEDRKQRATLIAASELHKTLYRLAHVTTLGSDEDTVRRWLKDAASWRSRL